MTLNRQELEHKISVSLKNAIGKNIKDMSQEKKLVEDLGLDSFAALELIYELEDTLGIKIPDEDARKFITVKDLLDYVSGKMILNQGGQHVG